MISSIFPSNLFNKPLVNAYYAPICLPLKYIKIKTCHSIVKKLMRGKKKKCDYNKAKDADL